MSIKLSEDQIRALATPQSYQRGEAYYSNGAVLRVIRRGDHIFADVSGSQYEPYKVQVALSEEGAVNRAFCTCPYDWGGYCKHIVAVLLTLVHDPDRVIRKPPIEDLLDGLNEEQLRSILLALAKSQTGLVEAIEAEIRVLKKTAGEPVLEASRHGIAVDLGAIKLEIIRNLGRLRRERDYGDYGYYDYDLTYPPAFLKPHLNQVEALLEAGEPRLALEVMRAIIDAWIDGLVEVDEWIYEAYEDAFTDAALDMDMTLAKVIRSLDLSEQEREELLDDAYYWDEELGSMDISIEALEQGRNEETI